MKESKEKIKKNLIDFLKKGNPKLNKDKKKLENKSLIEQGYIDSFGIIEIITFIEKKWKIKVKDEEITKDTFNSIDKITTFIFLKLK